LQLNWLISGQVQAVSTIVAAPAAAAADFYAPRAIAATAVAAAAYRHMCITLALQHLLLPRTEDNAYFLTVDRIRKLYNLPTDAFDGEGEAVALASYEPFEIGAVEEYALANGLIEEGESLSNIIERYLSDPDSVGGSSNPDATHVDLEVSSWLQCHIASILLVWICVAC
jgi:hypothetical protein